MSILGLTIATVIVLVAFFGNGLFAIIEDDLPGGFHNPDGTSTPPYIHRLGRILGIVALFLAPIVAMIGLSALPETGTAVLFLGLAVSILALALPKVWPKIFRWPSWASLIVLVGAMGVVYLFK